MPRSSPRAKRVLRKRGSGSPRKKSATKKQSPKKRRRSSRGVTRGPLRRYRATFTPMGGDGKYELRLRWERNRLKKYRLLMRIAYT